MNSILIDTIPKLRNPLLISAFRGWNDGGEASTKTVEKMIEQFEAKKFASIDPEDYYLFTENRPLVEVVDGKFNRKIEWQKNEFFYAPLPGTKRDLVLFLGTEPNLKWNTFCADFSALINRLEVKFAVTLGAFLADVLYTLPVQINGFSTDMKLIEDHGLERTNYEGPTGIVGVLNSYFNNDGLETLSLWAALPYYISIPNPKAVYAILSKLQKIFSFKMQLNELEKEADNFDNEINDVVAKDPNVAAYVRELKKRDFLN